MAKHAVIAGIGEVPLTKDGSGRSADYMTLQSARAAIADAGIDRQAVDAVVKYTYDGSMSAMALAATLGSTEADLYSGIAGTIRNQVTIYMSAQDPAGEYYPRITSARDSFGNEVEVSTDAGEFAGRIRGSEILRPGHASSPSPSSVSIPRAVPSSGTFGGICRRLFRS